MKPHSNMTPEDIKVYMKYKQNNELTPEEAEAYWEWVSEAEDQGCEASSIPIDGLEDKTDDEIWEMIVQKREERRKRNAVKAETAKAMKPS